MTCIACHSSWTTNCFGCHLSAKVNTKKPMLHNEGTESQVYASYNPEILRSDGYMLGIDGTIQGHKIAPVRSSSAVTLSVQNARAGVDRQPGADHFGRRVHRQRVQHPRAAHGSRQGNQAVHRLPRVGERRQQRVAGVADDARLEPGERHGPLHLRRARRRRRLGDCGHRA